jgi:hypothetical protein
MTNCGVCMQSGGARILSRPLAYHHKGLITTDCPFKPDVTWNPVNLALGLVWLGRVSKKGMLEQRHVS